jgi:CheY-like chemotaxis protein
MRREVLTPGVPVVAITAYAMPEDRHRILEAGFDHYLAKPVEIKGLLLLVRSLHPDTQNR